MNYLIPASYLLVNKKELMSVAYNQKIRPFKLKQMLRTEQRHSPMRYRVEVYNGEGYVHHSSYYKGVHAFKGMKTAAANRYGYARLVDRTTGYVLWVTDPGGSGYIGLHS